MFSKSWLGGYCLYGRNSKNHCRIWSNIGRSTQKLFNPLLQRKKTRYQLLSHLPFCWKVIEVMMEYPFTWKLKWKKTWETASYSTAVFALPTLYRQFVSLLLAKTLRNQAFGTFGRLPNWIGVPLNTGY